MVQKLIKWIIDFNNTSNKDKAPGEPRNYHSNELVMLVSLLIETVSLSLMVDSASIPAIGYQLLPIINDIIEHFNTLFTATEDPEKSTMSLLACL